MTLAIILSIIFFILGILHLNWAFGGKFGFDKALPRKENGERVFTPKKYHSGLVGLGLIAFGLFYLSDSGLVYSDLPSWILKSGRWIIPIIFILRATGDFNSIGFFKKIKNTEFANWDTKLYSPLCLVIGLLGLIIELVK